MSIKRLAEDIRRIIYGDCDVYDNLSEEVGDNEEDVKDIKYFESASDKDYRDVNKFVVDFDDGSSKVFSRSEWRKFFDLAHKKGIPIKYKGSLVTSLNTTLDIEQAIFGKRPQSSNRNFYRKEDNEGISLINKLNMIIEGEDVPEDDKEDDENIDESSSSLNSSIMERIAKKVKYNDYTGALRLAAKMLGSKKLERQFELIGELQKLDGSLNLHLEKYRMDLSKDIDSIAQRDLSKYDYILFNRAF
jgi:hypothetical protein